MSTPRVSVVIPSFNEGDWLLRTVRGVLEKTDYPDFDIVVVADGCTDDSVEKLKKARLPNLKILELSTSQGAVVARNKGAEVAQGEVLVFIDSHQEPVTSNWLTVLVDLIKKPNAGAATVNITAIGEKDRLGFLYTLKDWSLEPTWVRPENPNIDQKTSAIPGGCFAIKKTLFSQTGGFNPNLKKWGREDFEYSLRLWRLGYDLWFSPAAVMGHAFDHNRAFEISWDQVDYNTLWVAELLMDALAVDCVRKDLSAKRPKTYLKVSKALENSNFPAVLDALKPQLVRSFAEYKKVFDILPG